MTSMKRISRIFTLAAICAALFTSCKDHTFEYPGNEGTLSLGAFSLECSQEVEAVTKASAAEGTYAIFVNDEEGNQVLATTYAEVKSNNNSIKLKAGNYTLTARSTQEEVPVAEFNKPVYGASTDFSITAGKTTEIGTLTCTLLQCKVTVSYDDAFLASVTGAGAAEVEVTAGAPLSYAMTYGGSVSYDQREGYFAVNNGDNTTMKVTFRGSIDNKNQKMTAVFKNIKARQWRHIKFVKKIDAQGNATFYLTIDGYIDDEELTVNLNVESEEIIGSDPKAPIGDGGILLEFAPDCTMFSDLSSIVVPSMSTRMDLRLVATVPGGVKKFSVKIASTSEAFIKSVESAGGTTLDLIHPSEESAVVFQIVPFPHGEELLGQTSISFDLSNAQEAILAFPGTHTFTMTITDNNGCRKDCAVAMIVNE